MRLMVGMDAPTNGSATVGGKRYSECRAPLQEVGAGIWVAGRSRVIALTTFDLDECAYSALRAGASGFLIKDAHPGELLAAVRAVAAGDAVIAPP